MEPDKIQEAVGELLAAGHPDSDIISTLQEEGGLSHKEACEVLHGIYIGWQHTREELDLQENNLKDWHVFLRKGILQVALRESTISSLKLALSVLDSLATIQGISTEQGPTLPLSITLVEKKEDKETTPGDGDGQDNAV